MIRTLILTAAASVALAGAAAAQSTGDPGSIAGAEAGRSTNGAMDFVLKSSQSDEYERRAGRLAQDQAQSPQVRDFGAMMVSAHTKTTDDLKAAVEAAGMTPPPPPLLRRDQTEMLTALQGLHGAAFDRAYIHQQILAHRDALATTKAYAETGNRGPIREAARMTVPIIRQHLQMAQAMKMGG